MLLAAETPPVVVGKLVALLRVHLDDRPVAERERDVRAHQRVERGIGRRSRRRPRRGRRCEQLVDDAFDERDEQLLLVAEMAVDRRPGHACGSTDVDDADRVEPALGDELGGRVEQLLVTTSTAWVRVVPGAGISTTSAARATAARRS